ncbi:hypothetical protein V8E36_006397 [Tilletia maclaganii]
MTAARLSETEWSPRILIIDHHDSYTANLLTLLPPSTCANTTILQHTHPVLVDPARFAEEIAPHVDAIIISPGPGSPENAADFGTSARILRDCLRTVTAVEDIPSLRRPVLGVCLGHQGIACAMGARLIRTRWLQHGAQSTLSWSRAGEAGAGDTERTQGSGLFEHVPEGAKVVRYNSLSVDPSTLSPHLRVTAWAKDPQPLAPVPRPSSSFMAAYKGCRPPPNGLSVSKSEVDGLGEDVVLAIEHRSLPVYGVQFHPESIESEDGRQLMSNFLRAVRHFWSRDDVHGPNLAVATSRRLAHEAGHGLRSQAVTPASACLGTTSLLDLTSVQPPALSARNLQSTTHNSQHGSSGPYLQAVSPRRRPRSSRSDRSGLSEDLTPASSGTHSPFLQLPNSSGTSVTTISLESEQSESCSSPLLGQAIAELAQLANPLWRVVSRVMGVDAGSSLPKASDAPQVFDRLFRKCDSVAIGSVWLDSARPLDPHSRYSYMASPNFALSYSTISKTVRVWTAFPIGASTAAIQLASSETFWGWMTQLQTEMQSHTSFVPFTSCDYGPRAASISASNTSTAAPDHADRDGTMFRGGFAGYFGYELKAESLGLQSATFGREGAPDAEFLFCDRVLCYDHVSDEWTAHSVTCTEAGDDPSAVLSSVDQLRQALSEAGSDHGKELLCGSEGTAFRWFDEAEGALRDIAAGPSTRAADFHSSLEPSQMPVLQCDDSASTYEDKVEMARQFIAAGESYELCLTTAFRGSRAPIAENATEAQADRDHFGLYCALREKNPAPYSAYLRLPTVRDQDLRSGRGRAILSMSPERFLRVLQSGEAELKPIKGTLARAGFAKGEAHMLPRKHSAVLSESDRIDEAAKQAWRDDQDRLRRLRLAADPKERGENLMIVDLIRADLLSVCEPSSVCVPKLMRVESYATIHQLVTTVRGQLRPGTSAVEALRCCFPPGSMTGAPKRRSVQILEDLEAHGRQGNDSVDVVTRPQRGIYSGALGWLGLDGAADFAVVIRTAVAEGDDIYVGAGGAVTFASSAEGELSEMLHKASSVGTVRMAP